MMMMHLDSVFSKNGYFSLKSVILLKIDDFHEENNKKALNTLETLVKQRTF